MAIAKIVQQFLASHSIDYDLVPHAHTGSSHESRVTEHLAQFPEIISNHLGNSPVEAMKRLLSK